MDAFTREKTLMTVLARVAWADGVLAQKEADFFLETLRQLAFDSAQLAELFPLLMRPALFSELPLGELGEDDRRWLLGFACRMAAADGSVSEEEVNELQALARICEIPFSELYEEIAQHTVLAFGGGVDLRFACVVPGSVLLDGLF